MSYVSITNRDQQLWKNDWKLRKAAKTLKKKEQKEEIVET